MYLHLHLLPNLNLDFYNISMEYSRAIFQAHYTNLLFYRIIKNLYTMWLYKFTIQTCYFVGSQLTFTPYNFISSPHKLVILRITTNFYTIIFRDHDKLVVLRITMNLYTVIFQDRDKLIVLKIIMNLLNNFVEFLPDSR